MIGWGGDGKGGEEGEGRGMKDSVSSGFKTLARSALFRVARLMLIQQSLVKLSGVGMAAGPISHGMSKRNCPEHQLGKT